MDNAKKIEKAKQILGSEWIVDKILGGGNFGAAVGVYRARSDLTGNYHAVKVVEFNSSEQEKYRRREISLLTKDLSNRNVIRHFHEWKSKVEGMTYLCFKMELCLHDLHEHIRIKVSIVKDEDFYKVVFPQILNGLDAIHTMGWVHRDINLTNILVQLPNPKLIREIKVKIGGFMLARRLPSASDEDDLSDQATLEKLWPKPKRALYQAPELLADKKHCEKADLYSAGIVLYLLASNPEERKSWPNDEVLALREGKRNRTHLCHNNMVLHELLFSMESRSLLHSDPKCRPSAKEALRKLPLQLEPSRCDKKKNSTLVHDAIAAAEENLELVNDSLGKGSYGRVVSVKHKEDNKLYAVKIICSSPDKYKKRELAILTSQVDSPTTHENIVRYYNSWEFEGEQPTLCIRLELCDKNLGDVLKKNPEIVDEMDFHRIVFRQLLEALKYLHDKNWVHRDVHPRNILLKIPSEEDISSWVVKLADFGLARELSKPDCLVDSDPADSALSHQIGHHEYRAPEINTTDSYDCKVDMFSAGLVLYLLCSRFKSGKETEAFQDVRRNEKVNRDVLSHTSQALYDLMNDLVKRDPANRPSATEARVKFSEYLIKPDPSLDDIIASLSLDVADGQHTKQEDDDDEIDIC